jgi:hypothetical protein
METRRQKSLRTPPAKWPISSLITRKVWSYLGTYDTHVSNALTCKHFSALVLGMEFIETRVLFKKTTLVSDRTRCRIMHLHLHLHLLLSHPRCTVMLVPGYNTLRRLELTNVIIRTSDWPPPGELCCRRGPGNTVNV